MFIISKIVIIDIIIRLQCIARVWFPQNSSSEREFIIGATLIKVTESEFSMKNYRKLI